MIDFGPIDELREVRRRLSEQCGNDIHRYSAMLKEVATRLPGKYITQPLLPEASPPIPPRNERLEIPVPLAAIPPPERVGEKLEIAANV